MLSFIFDIKKNHAIVAWLEKGLPMSIEIKLRLCIMRV